jgi:thiamine-monophosphate kinase
MDEFALIRHYFGALTAARSDVVLGIGDDCALLRPTPGSELAVTADTLVAGRHFPVDTAPFDIGWKALAVNLSDLAAMAAEPQWFLLALTLPAADSAWLAAFAAGLRTLADQFGVALIGGDTTRGPLSITITAFGSAPAGTALRRSGARPGDLVCVTGTLGDAALGLQLRGAVVAPTEADDDERFLQARLDRPSPRVQAGLALRGLASAAIDLSDGLAGDLGHILTASGVGADLNPAQLPMSAAFARVHAPAQRLQLQAAGGDDYELCCCLPPAQLAAAQARLDLPLTVIGEISAQPGLRWHDTRAGAPAPVLHGYRHFYENDG